ncbi:HAMP domain-containing histidine kinase [Hymenobacter sp. NBH84]|uniref:sensor histidine kinase n=1 Tax=Hymenobacter sp. NBH84 TaxID=2596915 RepID=UPI00162ABC93|nr:HAMP domain-containing sensor histidine kinase [Hymenobacter sp. NBH84]QNE38824.1 HAMP domain-containing histidine kinase [Hymenobacter sp. NBH84]
MTIRNRLTLLFLSMVAVILAVALTVAYVLQARYSQREFRQRLRDRAEVTGYIFLEQDEMRAGAFRSFQHRYLQALNNEVLQIYDSNHQVRFLEEDERVTLSDKLLARIVVDGEMYFTIGSRQAIGLFYHDNQGDYIIVAAAENKLGRARLQNLALILSLTFVGSLAVIYVAGRIFAGRALAPIAAVNDQVDRITARDLHLRVDEGLRHEQDEIARLAHTFNRMLERLEESFEAQRTFVSNASHELRTPLTATIGEVQVLLKRDREPAEYREALASVLTELQQLKDLINNLLEFTQASFTNFTGDEIRLDELLFEAREAIMPPQRQRVQIRLGELPSDPTALETTGNHQLLARALTNLLDNALKYSGSAPVTVSFHYADSRVHIQIADQGIGIAEKDLQRIFQPFFRADNARGVVGHGVGLPLTRKIIELHGGQLHISSRLHEGTVVDVQLPTGNPTQCSTTQATI